MTVGDDTPAALAGQITSQDPAVGLRAVAALRRLLEELERLHVDSARSGLVLAGHRVGDEGQPPDGAREARQPAQGGGEGALGVDPATLRPVIISRLAARAS